VEGDLLAIISLEAAIEGAQQVYHAAAIVWRLEAVKSLFTGKTPLLTKETAATAQAKVYFNNEKFLKAFPSFQYRSMDTTIKRVSAELTEMHQLK
jgi:hypothetical protein